MCQHVSAYVSIRQHTSAYVSKRQNLKGFGYCDHNVCPEHPEHVIHKQSSEPAQKKSFFKKIEKKEFN
jgi:hypothetical protein